MAEETHVDMEKQHAEIFAFQAEISQLIHLFKEKTYYFFYEEIFLGELISNASHALDKIRYESITDPSKLSNCKDLSIKIILNKDDRTLTIIDNGIGMTKADLIKNPYNITNLGTNAFLNFKKLHDWSHMMEQYEYLNNAGFYSAYLVADRVTVTSKHNDDEQYTWESSADGYFIIRPDHGEPLGRGTKIVLYLKNDQQIYLEESEIKDRIKKCSHFICYPIKLVVQKERKKEVANHEIEKQTDDDDQQGWFSSLTGFFRLSMTGNFLQHAYDSSKETSLEQSKVEDIGEEDKMNDKKKIKEKYTENEILNNAEPLWMRNPDDISQEEYGQFYESLTNDSNGYLAVKHFSVEGQLKFRALLFVCKPNPRIFERRKNTIRLYMKRMFIMDIEDLKTDCLNFIDGVVEYEDLPLNISKEMLLQNKILLEVIRKNLEEKCLELFGEFVEDKDMYKKYCELFSGYLTEGISRNSTNSKKLTEFLRFYTSLSGDEYCSLRDYVSHMKENQKNIYFIRGKNRDHVANAAFVERVTKCGFEVIYMTGYTDDRLVEHLKEYAGMTLMSVSKEDLELPEDEEAKNKFEENKMKFENLCKVMKDILNKRVKKVVISNRLESSPCCIIRDTLSSSSKDRVSSIISGYIKIHLEINPDHPVIEKLRQKADVDKNDKSVKDLVELLFETSLQCSGFVLDNPQTYASCIYRTIELIQMHEEKMVGSNVHAA